MQLTISLNEKDRTLYADLSPGEEQEAITSDSLQETLAETGYPDLKLDPKKISEVVAKAQQGKECSIALKTLVDATASVAVGSDKRQAFLTLTVAEGGQPLTMEMVTQAMAKAGVVESLVDHETVNQCFERQSVKNICIAQARLPIEGKDAVYVPLVESESLNPPEMDDHGVADLLNTHHFFLVDVGAPLMRRVPATEGEAGLDVTGKELKPGPGKDPGFTSNLTGAVISSEDPNVLVATAKGHPVVLNNGVSVDPTLHMDAVDVTSGNITFDGSLEVKGDVAAGMTIEVTGDVFIQGGVDRATIQAGHNIKVGGGIFGEEEDDPMDKEIIAYQIKAGSNVEAKFVHLSTLTAGQNIVVKEYISHSSVKAGHHVLLGQDTGKGLLYGGHCEALHRVVLNQLGNEAYIPTHVIAGHFQELSREHYTHEHELATRSKEAAQLESFLQKLQNSETVLLGKTPIDKSQKIRNTLEVIKEKMARSQEQLQELEPELALQKEAAIEVTRMIYPNAVMTINGTTKRFSEQIGSGTWVPWEEDLVEQGTIEQEKPVDQEKKE